MTETTQPSSRRRSRLPIWALFGFAIVVALIFGLAAVLSSRGGTENKAVDACKAELIGMMRDPNSVEFNDVTVERGEDEPHGWLVGGNYRARNGFGGMNSDYFLCVTEPDGTEPEVLTGESLED